MQRVLGEQIAAAAAALDGAKTTDENIHTARKALKRARATLRLMRGAIPASAYHRENAALRDAARPLSAVRDARILLDAFDRIVRQHPRKKRQPSPTGFRRELAREQRAVRAQAMHAPGALQTSRRAVLESGERVARWRPPACGWTNLGPGIRRVYRHGRRAMREAHRACTAEALHEWRKQTKYLWNQLELLCPARHSALEKLASRAHKLSDALGDDHDFAVLREKAAAHPNAFRTLDEGEALLAAIEREQRRLRRKAFRIGEKLYDAKPGAFAARIARYERR